ncbi:MAG: hypothetical protein L0Y54_17775 [Sporichthyaceae bacterium]|nr:hypothetical protein [Sporichthyaceae bacterium]
MIAAPGRPLYQLTPDELERADRRYPKWASMCLQRRLGLPGLNAILVTPEQTGAVIDAAVEALATAAGTTSLMLRSDGGHETNRYYRGGNTFPLHQLPPRMVSLLAQDRAVILLEPTNRYTNQLSALLRLDRPRPGQPGQFTIEALGPGYDVGDLTRGGIPPQVIVRADGVDWTHYDPPWWSDLHLSTDRSQPSEQIRRERRLGRLADHLADTGQLGQDATRSDRCAAATRWLHQHGYLHLWQRHDLVTSIAGQIRRWFDDAFMIGVLHPQRRWTCLAAATSNLGARRWIYWDVVDGAHKYRITRSAA